MTGDGGQPGVRARGRSRRRSTVAPGPAHVLDESDAWALFKAVRDRWAGALDFMVFLAPDAANGSAWSVCHRPARRPAFTIRKVDDLDLALRFPQPGVPIVAVPHATGALLEPVTLRPETLVLRRDADGRWHTSAGERYDGVPLPGGAAAALELRLERVVPVGRSLPTTLELDISSGTRFGVEIPGAGVTWFEITGAAGPRVAVTVDLEPRVGGSDRLVVDATPARVDPAAPPHGPRRCVPVGAAVDLFVVFDRTFTDPSRRAEAQAVSEGVGHAESSKFNAGLRAALTRAVPRALHGTAVSLDRSQVILVGHAGRSPDDPSPAISLPFRVPAVDLAVEHTQHLGWLPCQELCGDVAAALAWVADQDATPRTPVVLVVGDSPPYVDGPPSDPLRALHVVAGRRAGLRHVSPGWRAAVRGLISRRVPVAWAWLQETPEGPGDDAGADARRVSADARRVLERAGPPLSAVVSVDPVDHEQMAVGIATALREMVWTGPELCAVFVGETPG